MPEGISFQIKDLNAVLAAIDTYNDKTQQAIDDVMTANAFDITADAKMLSPIDDSNLRNNIGFIDEPFKKMLYSNAAYSAYLEFGTGAYVDVPTIEWIDLPAYAMTFFVNGKGHIPPHPYFFPAIQKNIPNLIERLKKAIEINA